MTRPRSRHRLARTDIDALLAAARQGDREAFGELFRRYRRYANAVARACGARDVDEAVSESFRLVVSAIDAGSGPTVAFGPYLATTVRSVARRQRQVAARHDIVEPAALEGGLVSDATDSTADPLLATAFAALPERWQSVIWYVDVEGIPPRHVVDLVGVPSSNAASALLLRARSGLRVAYLDALVGEGHTPEVRAHLAALVAGAASTDELDAAAQWHLDRCPECREVAARVVALIERRDGRALAVSVVALMGFAGDQQLIPAGTGLGLGGFGGGLVTGPAQAHWGWIGAAAGTAVVGGVLFVATLAGSSDGDAETLPTPPASIVTLVPAAPATSLPRAAPPVTTPVHSTVARPRITSTTSTSSSSSTSSTTPATLAPPPGSITTPATTPPPPPAATDPPSIPTEPPPPSSVSASPGESTTIPASLPPDSIVTTTTTSLATTTSTVAPDAPVGHLGGTWALINGVLHIDLRVDQLTGEAGRIVFSSPMVFGSVSGATCASPTECSFSDAIAPKTVSISADTNTSILTIELFDSVGNLDDVATAG